MGLEVPSWAGKMFHVVTGDGWPEADEDEIHDLGRLWLAAGGELLRVAPEVTRSARYVAGSGALVGEGQRALAAAVALVTGDGELTLEKLAAGFEELGRYLQRVAVQTQYLKIIVIEELVILAAQIAYLVAMMPWTFGASAAGIAGLQIFGRQFAVAVLRQLAIAVATGEVLQVGLDAIAQLAQMAEGWRNGGEWDWDLTKSAAITGVVGGVLGPVFQGLGHYPGRLLAKALAGVADGVAGSVVSRNAGREVAGWAADVVTGAGHEYVTDGTSSLVQGGGWRPDMFSLTAGAADEATTGLAGIGRRKRHLAAGHTLRSGSSLNSGLGLSLGLGKTPWADLPDHLDVPDRRSVCDHRSTWWRSMSGAPGATAGATAGVVLAAGRVRSPEVLDLTGFWDPGPSHRVTVLDDDAHERVARPEVVASGGELRPVRTGPVRRSDEEKLALLAEYERAVSQLRGRAWLREHGFDRRRVSDWRRLRQTAALPVGDLRMSAVASSSLSAQQKADLVREYQDAVLRGQGKQWLTARGLTTNRLARWQPTSGPASSPVPGSTAGSVPGSVAGQGTIEVEAGQAFTLDDLDPVPDRQIRRSHEEKLALLADYEQAASQLRGRAWLREHGFDRRRVSDWRRLRETVALPADDPRLSVVRPWFLSLEQKAGLVREYWEAFSQGWGQQWLAVKNLTRDQIGRWQSVIRSAQQQTPQLVGQPVAQPVGQEAVRGDGGGPSEIVVDPAVDFGRLLSPTDHDTALSPVSGPVPGSEGVPGLIEVEAGRAFTLDDLDSVPYRYIRRSDGEKLALLADYEEAVSQQRGNAWLREHGINSGRISGWRRLRDAAGFPEGDSRHAATAYSSLSLEQKAGLVREHQDAVSRGQGRQWLAARNLTAIRLARWQTLVRSAQQQAVRPATSQRAVRPATSQRAVPGGRGGPSEILVDPAVDFGRLLSPTDHDPTPSPVPGSVAGPGLIEVEAGQTFTLDDLDPVRVGPIRRSDEEKLALLADYEQAASQRKGRAWLREHGFNPGRPQEWRRLREMAQLAVGDPGRGH